eukprot:gnl/TRDRNA2_/TRDRNA2_143978_c1_seq1.p1 gnl/TRDRNA2_/TRDRNA2_143978_c1~~gnl/TRDRNA2_/TRDRNA2_143978_c1_seq1.p1  ORF type:complete len:183 (-),score=22.65 gnl/TRDRNA2_/TRDRNA2_143978_c1_seq1:18-566(-)
MEDEEGTVYYRFWSAHFSIGKKIAEFDNAGTSRSIAVRIPHRPPDATERFKTSVLQSYMYSLTGDFNAPHVDQAVGEKLGYGGVIMQGLGSCGISSRAVLRTFGSNQSSNFHAVRVRFSQPVMPGQTLETQMWNDTTESAAPVMPVQAGMKRIVFRTVCLETGDTVISNAYMDLRDTRQAKL